MNQEIEEIPLTDKLYYRIHKIYIDQQISDKNKKIIPSAFDPQPKPDSTELSTNWSKYSTPEFTKNSARKPDLNGVVSLKVKKVVEPPINLFVRHSPF